MKHCALPPRPPLKIKRKIRKGSKLTKLKQNHTHALTKASETTKTPAKNILEITIFKTFFVDLKTKIIVIKLNIVTMSPFCFPRSRLYDSVTKLKGFVFTK